MCNLSDLVEEEAREKALKEGHAKGCAEGIETCRCGKKRFFKVFTLKQQTL